MHLQTKKIQTISYIKEQEFNFSTIDRNLHTLLMEKSTEHRTDFGEQANFNAKLQTLAQPNYLRRMVNKSKTKPTSLHYMVNKSKPNRRYIEDDTYYMKALLSFAL